MQMNVIGKHQIVLLGIGHTNAHIVRQWKMAPLPDCTLICVSDDTRATYSGMLPGVLSGQYQATAMELDLVRLAGSAGAQLIVDRVSSVDVGRRKIEFFGERPALEYDWLSIGVGSQPNRDDVTVADRAAVVSIKPMQTFLSRLTAGFQTKLEQRNSTSAEPFRVVIVGGGAGSIEVGLCLGQRHRHPPASYMTELDKCLAQCPQLSITLCTAGKQLGTGLMPGTLRHVERTLQSRQIEWLPETRVVSIDERAVHGQDGQIIPADLVIWATHASPPPVLKNIALPKDDRGFVLTRGTLQSTADDRVFAVGDSGTLADSPTAKAGVYAVRQGPVLWENLQRGVRGKAMVTYQPQRNFLKLLNTGDGRAILEYKGWSWHSRMGWWLKNRIDVKFMAMYQDYSPRTAMTMAQRDSVPQMSTGTFEPKSPPAMRCVGCGGKVRGGILKQVLTGDILNGENALPVQPALTTDVAFVDHAQSMLAHTVDFFAAPLDDPWMVGRLTALNALSDLYVSGCRPETALMFAQVPWGPERGQQRLLRQAIVGVQYELRRAGARLIGGHTIEGERLALGLAMTGVPLSGKKYKQDLRAGDVLILTKPLGTGCLLAAWHQHRLPADEYQTLVEHLLQGNEIALELWRKYSVSAMTDITGFGLAGHAREMLEGTQFSLEIDWSALVALPGYFRLSAEGIESTLTGPNREDAPVRLKTREKIPPARLSLLHDPQTCGGILCAVPQTEVAGVLNELRANGFPAAEIIGRVLPREGVEPEVSIVG